MKRNEKDIKFLRNMGLVVKVTHVNTQMMEK